MFQKLKAFIAEDVYFYSILLVLIAVVSFGLGRMSMVETSVGQQGSVTLAKQPSKEVQASDMQNVSTAEQMQLVGSKNGSKYHALWCPGASQIKEANKIFFSSEGDAQAKGYTQAGNCDM